VTINGVWIGGFIDHLHTQLRTTSNYSVIADLNTLQITTAPAKTSSRLLCLQQPFHNNSFERWRFFSSHAQVLSSQPPMQNQTLNQWLKTNYSTISSSLPCRTQQNWLLNRNGCPSSLLFNSLAWTTYRQYTVSPVTCVTTATGMCLLIRCLEMGCITPLFMCLLHSKGFTCHSINLELHLYYGFHGLCCTVQLKFQIAEKN
jgi:hypothetical protein